MWQKTMAIYGNVDANYQVVSGTAAGTVTIKAYNALPNNSAGHLYSVYVPNTLSGTISYYDGAGTTGTLIATVANNGSKQPDLFPFMCRFTNGLTAILSAGTSSQSVFWD